MVLVPALLMVSTIRFRSVKAIDMGWQRSYLVLFPAAIVLALIASHPRLALVIMAYAYVAFAFLMWGSESSGGDRVQSFPGSRSRTIDRWISGAPHLTQLRAEQ